MIHLSGSGYAEDPHLEDYEFDPQMYIQHENPYFEAKLYKNRPNELVRILIFSLVCKHWHFDNRELLSDMSNISPFT